MAIQHDYGRLPNPTPLEEPDYDKQCRVDLGSTYCDSCGNDELECRLPIGHAGPHYDHDSHHWADVFVQPEADDARRAY